MLKNILKEQVRIFEESIALEDKKHQKILEAKGFELQKLLQKSEKTMLRLEELEKDLFKESCSFLGLEGKERKENPPDLREILEYSRAKKPKEAQELEKLMEKYREVAQRLKDRVQSNQRLLMGTKDRIQKLLQDLQTEEQSLFSGGYSPSSSSSKEKSSIQRQAKSRLLNTES